MIDMKIDFNKLIFELTCDDQLAGTKKIKKDWKLVPYLYSRYILNYDIQITLKKVKNEEANDNSINQDEEPS